MKKGKICMTILSLLLLSGCTVEYNLNIDKDNMTETIKGIYPNTKENQEIVKTKASIRQSAYYDMDLGRTNYYTVTTGEDTKKKELDIQYQYVYDSDNLQKSSALNYCSYKKTVIKTKDYILLNTDGKINCMYKDTTKVIDKIVINITTSLNVVEQNADTHRGNTYTWTITDKNFNNKPIHIKMSLEEKETVFKQFSTTQILIGIACVIIVLLLFIIYWKHRFEKNNKI